MPVGHLIHGTATSPPISTRELQEWSAFERVCGPILLHERIEVSNAFVAMTIAAANSDGRKFKLQDFMPRWDGVEEEQGPEDIVRFLKEQEAKWARKKEAKGV